MIIKTSRTVLIAVIGIAAASTFWWFSLNDSERWLISNKTVVEQHALALLSGEIRETPGTLQDATITAYDGVVEISFHDNHDRALIFIPDESQSSQFLLKNKGKGVRALSKGWYEVLSIRYEK